MKLYVRSGQKWIVVPCMDEHGTVGTVITGAKQRFSEIGVDVTEKESHLTSPGGHVVYSNSDVIKEVLQDQQFVELRDPSKPISLEGELPDVKPASEKSAFEAKNKAIIVLDGNSLTTETLCSISSGNFKIQLSREADVKVKRSRAILDEIVEQHKIVYGVSTGFGKFARVAISSDQLGLLQDNLIESHCAGVGPPLSPQKTRMLLAVRINVLSKGYSGISSESLATLVKAFNCSCLPWVPELGTVGASGDLAPLSHMALGLCGKGKMWSPESGWAEASDVLRAHDITPLSLKAKEGLALINGTQFISSIGSEAVERARKIALQADVITALTLEALNGTSRAFDEAIHNARPHKGQREVAKRLRTLLQYGGQQSEITVNHRDCDRVQDAYTLRCCPQVHGIVHDTIAFVKSVLDVELNSATDNPMVLVERGETISGGNFHGEYPAKVLDYLAIGVSELGSISERRIERMCNPAYSDLPAFLVDNGGLNSGYMIPHCTAAALVSENKCLCHPSSVDSLSTSAGQEDHVSMGGWAARKALKVVEHVENVLAIELLCACQGIEFHRPLKTTQALEAVHHVVRQVVKPYDKDRVQSPDIEAVTKLLRENKIWEAVEGFMDVPIKKTPHDYSSSPTSSYLNSAMSREA